MPEGMSAHPSREELASIFQNYQDQRIARVKKIYNLSGLMTRVQAWENVALRLVASYVFPWFSDARVADLFADAIKGAVKLDYVKLLGEKTGTAPWVDAPKSMAGYGRGRRGLFAVGTLVLSVAILGLLLPGTAARLL